MILRNKDINHTSSRNLDLNISAGIGDNLVVRIFLDTIRNNYSQIRISHSQNIINQWRDGNIQYKSFLNNLGHILFTESPYSYDNIQRPFTSLENISKIICNLKIIPTKPNIDHLLCKGTSLNLGEEYIIITTKIRHLSKKFLYSVIIQLLNIIKKLSKKYKIVIIGERNVETNKEYALEEKTQTTFSIYEQIISNIDSNRVLDLTIPALGITVPQLKNIQQDCLIMKEAKFVITLGVGGNLWLALSVANTIGFRSESLGTFSLIIDKITNPKFDTAFLSRDWNVFIQKLAPP